MLPTSKSPVSVCVKAGQKGGSALKSPTRFTDSAWARVTQLQIRRDRDVVWCSQCTSYKIIIHPGWPHHLKDSGRSGAQVQGITTAEGIDWSLLLRVCTSRSNPVQEGLAYYSRSGMPESLGPPRSRAPPTGSSEYCAPAESYPKASSLFSLQPFA